MSSFFVVGTDTNVGKTTACRAIIQALQAHGVEVVGFKPIACGCEESLYPASLENAQQHSDYDNLENSDVLTLMHSTTQEVAYQEVNSYTFSHNLPMLGADGGRIKLAKIDETLAKLNQRFQTVVVEGSFGFMTPMAEGKSFADWVSLHKMPVVLVVGIKEGCINHALLTAKAIENLGVPMLGWIANRINPGLSHYAEIIEILSRNINAPLLGKLPYVHKPETQEMGHYLTELDPLLYMQTLQAK